MAAVDAHEIGLAREQRDGVHPVEALRQARHQPAQEFEIVGIVERPAQMMEIGAVYDLRHAEIAGRQLVAEMPVDVGRHVLAEE